MPTDVDDDCSRHFENRAKICKLMAGYDGANSSDKEDIEDQINVVILNQTQDDFWKFHCTYGGARNLFFYLLGRIEKKV